MGIFDWLFGTQRQAIQNQHEWMDNPFKVQQLAYQKYLARMQQAMSPQDMIEHQLRMNRIVCGIQKPHKPELKWDGKIWYPLDLAHRPKGWDGKIWYPLGVKK